MVIDALLRTNELLGTTTLVITHNATIQDVAHRVLSFANGRIAGERLNETRRPAAELAW
jgi:putative ABC transport system ATP-binding protein